MFRKIKIIFGYINQLALFHSTFGIITFFQDALMHVKTIGYRSNQLAREN